MIVLLRKCCQYLNEHHYQSICGFKCRSLLLSKTLATMLTTLIQKFKHFIELIFYEYLILCTYRGFPYLRPRPCYDERQLLYLLYAPVAQRIERWPPEPGAWVRVPPGAPSAPKRRHLPSAVSPLVGGVHQPVEAKLGAERLILRPPRSLPLDIVERLANGHI